MSSPLYQVAMLCWLVHRIWPSQLSCLNSLVGKNVAWKAGGRGLGSHPRQPIYQKMTVSGELCCVALPFCCVVVVTLPFSASLEVIVHLVANNWRACTLTNWLIYFVCSHCRERGLPTLYNAKRQYSTCSWVTTSRQKMPSFMCVNWYRCRL